MDSLKNLRLAVGMTLIALLPGQAIGQVRPSGANDEDDLTSIFPPVQREYRLALGRAEKAIAEEEWAAAVEELTRILNGEDQNDYFLASGANENAQTSLKTQALKLLGSLPPKGRSLYELKCGHEARNLLDQALEKGDAALLTEVARRYFHTEAGYEAAILLGRLNLDRGRPLAAAMQFARVAEVGAATASYDPELSLLLATSWLHAQHPEQALQTLVSLKQRMPKARVRLGNDEVGLFASDEQALEWLTRLVGQGGKARTHAATQWVMFRGNEMRNASSIASLPLLNYRWSLPMLGDPPDVQRVKNVTKTRLDKPEPLVPSVQPLVVNNYVIFRTPDMVVGAELGSGKRVWRFPWDETTYEKQAKSSGNSGRAPAISTREQELHQRLFEDHPFGQLASDGEQVFFLDEMGLAPSGSSINPNNVFRGPRVLPNQLAGRPFNKLVSLDIKRQGALRWIVGGESGVEEPALAGAFFLGPPLPLAGQLYILAEFNGEIRLLCLAGQTGKLEWQQTLAVMTEQHPITGDGLRRLAGASPSFANGLLICPTSGGGAVAVDLATRTLRWGYRYPRWDISMLFQPGFRGFRRNRDPQPEQTQQHWIDSSATIAEGCVLLTPVESDKLHCLDLLTGKPKWEPQPRGELLFVGCVHEGKAVFIGRNQIKALKLEDGSAAWPTVIDLGEDTPTGRGYYSGRYYYLPLTSSQLLTIDLDKGEVASRVKTEVTLGNLVCHQEDLISHSGELVTAFYLTEPLRKRTEELLAKNPADAWALARKGEILLQDGKQREAVEMLRKAHQLEPNDEATRSMLVRVIVSLLREDYDKHADLVEEAAGLVKDQPALAREFDRLRAVALQKSGKLWEAFEAYLAIGVAPPSDAEALEEVARDHQVRRDRWIAGRLAALYDEADEAIRGKMTAEIEARLAAVLKSGDVQTLRDFLGHFGFHPLADQAVLSLARALVESNQPLEAELIVGRLASSTEPNTAAVATAVLASAYEKSEQFDLAAHYYAELGAKYADVVCHGELTGAEVSQTALAKAELAPFVGSGVWPTGLAEATTGETVRAGMNFNETRYPIPFHDYRGAAPRGLKAAYLPQRQAIQIRSGLGRMLSGVSLSRFNGSNMFLYNNVPGNAAGGRLNGHLVLVSLGGEVFAINALGGKAKEGDGLLWREEVIPPDPTGRRYLSSQHRQIYNPLLGGSKFVASDPQNQVSVGPVTPLGVCYQKNRQLVCVEPLTGKIVWERTLGESGCEIFGDEERIVVVPPKSGDALIISPIDGELLDRRKIDMPNFRWTTCGRNVLVWEELSGTQQVRLQLYDASNQGTGLWKREVKKGSRGFVIDGEELALLEPGGQFTIVSLASGKELLSQKPKDLEKLEDNDLDSIMVLRSKDQYLLMANQRPTDVDRTFNAQPLQSGQMPNLGCHGHLLAFDRASGKEQWPAAAFISQHGLAPDQPIDSPILFFVRKLSTMRGGAARRNTMSVLAIDKRDGRIVFEDDSFLGDASYADVVADPAEHTVSLTVSAYQESRTVTIKLTDQPAAPQPPAQTGAASSLNAGQVAGVVDDDVAEMIETMRRAELLRENERRQILLPAQNFDRMRLPRGFLPPR